MPDKKLLSIAEISRLLEVPESTLHYWKNRFAQYLPSTGRNRQKRFKSEAIEIFKIISSMLKQGHTAEDVMAELSRKYPVNVAIDAQGPELATPAAPAQIQQANLEPAIQLAAAMGTEIAKSINEGLKGMLSCMPQGAISEDVKACMDKATADLNAQNESIAGLKDENIQLKEKLSIMEAELVRLRKDRREMEKFLLDKLKNVTK
ncbi:MerR family transcriptional regulator [Maridesulfovibrio salexigens]|uniref:Putative transcriptional regulator, MerR family n=1 Tax=Maridesulfovibrio salexigens (strain ATCC 14822 / DSM 2638 / NCIMB 8403 / VKM B-1763) TaxID=526222 RepID=C6BSM0_MARSD|nr:MerR family transcriptional regulator [Maridesulfovibrio salexigens]ACS81476.1 putative transcriptional regulator, MerR family [Maridesulfovibrio salexigens DSM 2638]